VCLEAGKTATRGETKAGNRDENARKSENFVAKEKCGRKQDFFRSLYSRRTPTQYQLRLDQRPFH
jgi:hypothetical protein